MFRFLLIFFLGGLLPGLLHAEKLELRFLSWESLNRTVIFYKDGSGYKELSIRSHAQSPPYDYFGPSPISFYVDGVDATGKPAKIEVAQADVPKEMKHPLLMFFEKKSPTPGVPQYDVKVVDDSVENFPFGSYCLFNFSRGAISGHIEKQDFNLAPDESRIIQLDDQTRRNIAVKFFGVEGSQPPQVWKEAWWRHEPEKRLLVFMVNSPDPKAPGYMLKIVEEHSVPPPPTPPKP